jgi:amino acid adenylation domain-containing protein/non-ribosomal peptide synthase protein (TIGR01720 family)
LEVRVTHQIARQTEGLADRLRDVYRHVLSKDDIGIDDDISQVASTSLPLSEIVSAIRKEQDIRISPIDVLQASTIRQLAEILAGRQSPAQAPAPAGPAAGPSDLLLAVPPAVADEERFAAPASFSQETLWLIDQIEGGSTAYNLSTAVRSKAGLKPAVLRRSFEALLCRHEVLRTHFVQDVGLLRQVVRPQVELPWQEVYLAAAGDPVGQEAVLRERLKSFAQQPFDLGQGPLLRCCLYGLGPDDRVLQFVVHHSVFDGWSQVILMRELIALYRSIDRNGPSPLAPLAAQFRDFAQWQRTQLRGEVLDGLGSYWSRQLADLPPLLDLPTDRPRPGVQSFRGHRVARLLPPSLAAGLKTVGRQSGATLFMTMLAAFDALLFRYSGQTDIAVGTPVANRDRHEFETVIGFFVNTVVMRARIDPSMPFAELLEHVKKVTLDAYEHQRMPFEQVVELVNPARSLSYSPLFQVMFEFQGSFGEDADLGALGLSPIQHDAGTAKYDLSLEISHGSDGLFCSMEYAADLFHRDTIERMLGHFETLLRAIVEDPARAVADLPLLTDGERHEILVGWNDTDRIRSGSSCIHRWFEERAEEQPEAVALRFEDRSVTYSALNAMSNRLAHWLLARNVGRETRVAICAERSVEMVAAILAILKSGGSYVPIDPRFPRQRMEFILEDSGAVLLLTQESLRAGLPPDCGIPVLCLDSAWPRPDGTNATNPESGVEAADCAYVLYTSGSTGTPKGVVLPHESVMNTLRFLEYRYPVGEGDRYLLKTNYVFDVSVPELFGWFVGRGSLVILPPGLEGSPDLMADCIRRDGVTHVNFSPAMLRPFVVEIAGDEGFRKGHSLRFVLVAGEAFPKDLATEAVETLAPAAVENLYGPTEAAIFSTAFSCTAVMEGSSTPIGRPLANTRAYVLDDRLQPVPVGVPGELHLAGAGLARGYLNRPELTRERFIPNPFEPGRKLYRTGDRVRWLPQGDIEYLERTDFQVKIRGMRIELGEIEARLAASGFVRAALVLAQPLDAGDRQLVGYVVPSADRAAGLQADGDVRRRFVAGIMDALKRDLPDYMVPLSYVILDSLPLTPTGKIDRKALSAMRGVSAAAGSSAVPPRTRHERILRDIWKEVLCLEDIGIRDNFFASGGDSILSIQVAARARAQGLSLSARQVFQHQTIEELAAHARATLRETSQDDSTGGMVLLPIHRQFFDRHGPDFDHYHQSRLLDLPSGFDPAFLTRWVGALYRRHDALRLRYRKDGDGWKADFVPLNDAMIAASVELSAPGGSGGFEQWAAAVRDGIDIKAGPLFKAAYLAGEGPAPPRLLLVLHHLVVDGVSWRIILDDLRLACSQWEKGQAVALGRKSDSYQSWASALLEYSRTESLAAERGYWLSTLEREVPPLPVDRLAPAADTRVHRQVELLRWNADETTALLSGCHDAYRTQINELLLSGLLLAIHRWTGHRAVRIAMEGHGREVSAVAHRGDPDSELDLGQTVGWFTSYYPLVLSIPGTDDGSVRDRDCLIGTIIKSVKEQCRAVPHRGLGYGVIRYLAEDAALAKAEAEATLEIVFNYLGQFDTASREAAGFKVSADKAGLDIGTEFRREHRIGLNGEVSDGCLSFELDYSSREYDRETIEGLAAHFTEALRDVIAHCRKPGAGGLTPSDFPLAEVGQHEVDRWHALHPTLEDLYPAVGMQIGMMFHSRMPGEESAYTNQIFMTLGDGFRPDIFRKAWASLIARHAILRTAIVGMDREQPLQLIVAEGAAEWRELDHGSLDEEQALRAFEACRGEDRGRPFDFGRPPLMRFTLVRERSRHRFIWTYHHSLLDGWSVALIRAELARTYQALCRSAVPDLPPVTPYADYIRWRLGQEKASARAYWRAQLEGVAGAGALRIEQEGLPFDPAEAPKVRFQLSEEQTRRLEQAARTHQVTVPTIAQAAWAYLLHLYGKGEDVVFGVTVSGRAIDLKGVETIAGLLINTVPARVPIDPALPIGEWLRSIHRAQVEREANSHLDLIDIQRCADTGVRGPLFDSLLIFENYPASTGEASTSFGLTDYQYDEQTHYGLTLLVMPGEKTTIDLDFDPSRFDRGDMAAMAEKLKTILYNFSAVPDGSVHALSAGTSSAAVMERTSAGTDAGASRVSRQGELRLGRYLVHQLVENHAEDSPEKLALVCNEKRYSFDELNRAANRMANHLLAQVPGLKADSLVGVSLPRSDRLLITILAIWKAGAAYIPIDPALPSPRVHSMLQSSDALLVIADAECAARHPYAEWGTRVIFFEDGVAEAGQSDANPDVNVSGSDLSYVIYTSGSTGAPKGAMVEHIGMLNNIANKIIDFEIDARSRVAQTASQSFDISVWQMFIALTQGATTFIYDDRTINDIGRFVSRLETDGITLVEMVPTYLILVMEHLDELAREDLRLDLRFLVLTGETADASFIRRWFDHFPDTKVANAYGPTEASDDITHHVLSAGDEIANPVPIGRTLANFDIYIVDENLKPVPRGEKGEIVVTGVGVGRGYVNMAGATSKAFVESPFPDKYKGRLYKTGDVGQMREDGVILFHGRKDKQVKVRGFRIELEEIELKLLELPAVRQAVVLDIKPPGREAFLCAFVVLHGGQDGDKQALTGELKEKLPAYMVPTEFRFLERMPQLDNGKIDRKALRDRYGDFQARIGYVAPSSDAEVRLARIWSEVLGIDRVGIRDDFFDIGGDSFKAIRIAAKYGPELEVTDIYNFTTIEALAERVARNGTQGRRLIVPVAGVTPAAKVAVLGISNSGGDPISFFETGRELSALGDEMALYAVKLPRNSVRDGAEMLAEIDRLTEEICDAIEREIAVPLILFAQCNGSALAISLAARLKQRSAPVRALCIGGALLRTRQTQEDRRSDQEILGFLKSVGSTLPQKPDETAFFLSDFRYDCAMADNYYNFLVSRMTGEAGLDRIGAPIWCIVGTEDPLVSGYRQHFRDWERLSDEVTLVEYPGHGHYLLRDCALDLARTLREVWREIEGRIGAGGRK